MKDLHIEFLENFYSPCLNRIVKVEIVHPLRLIKGLPILILNDGQDNVAMQIHKILHDLWRKKVIAPFILASVHAGERKQEYGVAGKPDFAKRGARAKDYSDFIAYELLPYLRDKKAARLDHPLNCIAGYSLGGLSALDIAWDHPEYFKKAGAFSGSFWWRKKALDQGYTDADRIMHAKIRNSKKAPALKIWLQAGTNDETADRNNNGIIDAIDDTLDLIAELIMKGYKPYRDVVYREIEGGEHNAATWRDVMPEFLIWAFANR